MTTTATETSEATRSVASEPSEAPVRSSDGLGGTTFRLYKYNPRRRARGVEAAEVEVTWPDGEKELLWMTVQDIKDNLKQFGESQGLRDALEAYRLNAMPPNAEVSDRRAQAPDNTTGANGGSLH